MKWISIILTNIPFNAYCAFLVLIAGIYIGTIGSLLFNFWVIPKIEKRYNTKLVFDNPLYAYNLFNGWMVTEFEISFYIFFKLIGWKKPYKHKYAALEKINYDIKTASKVEVVMSLITITAVLIIIFCGAVVAAN